ncbi:unnamed protein product [Didymodactylos carnosus]|uniref:Uncharacterized protein n=1 Tax=Didymodactylos carnosus TaxID=1234261 RepID=A0A816AJJ4_9BILA|nr:unnamed protein product [Didymodactylos carnosus]CAF1618703.1 unnamed protein product [Didymodactylos carnosus]CAF4436787.1 unnamed protein product [Didymodactylos carnosus]CAF4473202.1 unnamed protein product [Didymodactylos carnosus]
MIITNAIIGGGAGDLHLWYQLNGQQVENSNAIQTVSSENEVSTTFTQLIVEIKQGDYLEIVYSSTNSQLGLQTVVVDGQPTGAALTVTIFREPNCHN